MLGCLAQLFYCDRLQQVSRCGMCHFNHCYRNDSCAKRHSAFLLHDQTPPCLTSLPSGFEDSVDKGVTAQRPSYEEAPA